MRPLLLASLAVGALGTGCCTPAGAGPAPAAPAGRAAPVPSADGRVTPPPGASQRVPGEYIVTVAPGADRATVEAVYGSLGLARLQSLGSDMYLVTVREDPGPERMEALRAKDARVQAVQPNFVYRTQ